MAICFSPNYGSTADYHMWFFRRGYVCNKLDICLKKQQAIKVPTQIRWELANGEAIICIRLSISKSMLNYPLRKAKYPIKPEKKRIWNVVVSLLLIVWSKTAFLDYNLLYYELLKSEDNQIQLFLFVFIVSFRT